MFRRLAAIAGHFRGFCRQVKAAQTVTRFVERYFEFLQRRGGLLQLEQHLAEELARDLDLPVYLYDRAARTPERRSLADVRRGEYEGLRDAVAKGERVPDAGPHAIGPAGATAVGARKPLVAFNVYLTGGEDVAKDIARTIRESSGGLPALRAIYRAETAELAELRLGDFEAEWGNKYPAIGPAWRRAARRRFWASRRCSSAAYRSR